MVRSLRTARRGGDGRCVNCDPWYTSPLVQVGVPALAATAAALVLLVSVAGPKPSLTPTSQRSAVTQAPVLATPSQSSAWNGLMPSSPSRSGVQVAPTYIPPPTVVAWTPTPEAVSPERRQWDELEQLRSLVWSAAAAERMTEPRSFGQFERPRFLSSAVAAAQE